MHIYFTYAIVQRAGSDAIHQDNHVPVFLVYEPNIKSEQASHVSLKVVMHVELPHSLFKQCGDSRGTLWQIA